MVNGFLSGFASAQIFRKLEMLGITLFDSDDKEKNFLVREIDDLLLFLVWETEVGWVRDSFFSLFPDSDPK